ncbi:MAG TPA: tRNA(His) guanylyltransferase Thg1 family protein [Thermoplasmata archaeon]|nr:tRNA(His) guanylyltransferase Thg1 family protein [Thermoplasmata archaeon]
MKVYEEAFNQSLPRRLPVVIRVDGRAFHTFTKGIFERPFDDGFRAAMADTAKFLCEGISGAKFAYTQSDEVSVLVTNDDKIETQAWFDNDLSKIISLSASLATVYFRDRIVKGNPKVDVAERQPQFDARAFVVPHDEVCNYFVWRQRDWTRNSIQMAARAHFTQKEIQGLDNPALQEKLWKDAKVNWNDYPAMHKRGVCIVPGGKIVTTPDGETKVRGWKVDFEPPILTKERRYVEERFRWPTPVMSKPE